MTSEWFAVESFWETLYPYLFSPDRLAAAPAEVDAILVLTGLDPEDRLAMVGFESLQVLGGLDGKPYGVDAERLVVRARKPGGEG